MKNAWILLSLVVLIGSNPAPASSPPDGPHLLVSSETPALIVKDTRIDPHDGKIRGTVVLRFGYGAPILPHVHVYGLDVSGRVIADGCDKLGGQLLSSLRPSGHGFSTFAVNLDLSGVTTVRVVASAGHGKDCKLGDNRIFKLF